MGYPDAAPKGYDVYFSADVETDGPIPGPFSMLSFGLVYAGAFDGTTFYRPPAYVDRFYVELCPISDSFEREALAVNGLDRTALLERGANPAVAMTEAADWVRQRAGIGSPVIVAYPLSFDWMWLYWYFMRFSATGSPFAHSRGFDIKTALSIKLGRMISKSGRSRIPEAVRSSFPHTHNALDDATEQAEIFANVFAMEEIHE
ncbi:MAG: exonuclease [Novosphingobium sp. PASSN1]|nr:MAG: exonuclease [Novosphingobium sp. PASSN1]